MVIFETLPLFLTQARDRIADRSPFKVVNAVEIEVMFAVDAVNVESVARTVLIDAMMVEASDASPAPPIREVSVTAIGEAYATKVFTAVRTVDALVVLADLPVMKFQIFTKILVDVDILFLPIRLMVDG